LDNIVAGVVKGDGELNNKEENWVEYWLVNAAGEKSTKLTESL
jgi:hypothetical protein